MPEGKAQQEREAAVPPAPASPPAADETAVRHAAHYRELFRHAPIGIALLATDGRLLDVNPKALEIHGFPRDQIVGQPLARLELLYAEDVPRLRDVFRRVVAGEELPPIEARLRHREGGTRWVEATVLRLDQGGAPWAVQLLFRDVTRRKETEAALRRTIERYRSLLDGAADGILLLQPDGTIVESNRSMDALAGAPAEALVGRQVAELLTPEDVAQRPLALRGLEPGDCLRVERTLRHRQGRRVPVDIVARRLEDGRILAILRDLTDRRETERALAESEKRLRTAITGSALVLFAVDAEGRFTFSLGRGLEKLGLLPGEVVGESVFERYADVPAVGEAIRRGLAGEALDSIVNVGGLDWEVRYEPQEDEQGRIVGVTGVATDITERRQAERALRRSEARYRALAEHSAVGIWQVTPEGHTVYANPAMLALLEVEDVDALSGMTWDRFFETDGGPDATRAGTTRMRLVAATGRRRDVMVSKAPVLDAEGAAMSLIGTFVDVTEQERARAERDRLEERVRQAEKLESLGLLAGGVAHDFNNLLTGVLGNAAMALDRLETDHRARGIVERIEQAARWAADLTRQLLAYAGRGQVILQEVDLSVLLAEMKDILDSSMPAGVTLAVEASKTARVRADVAQMRQLVLNLAKNAAEACQARGGRVEIRADTTEIRLGQVGRDWLGGDLEDGTYVLLRVLDDGEGMAPGTREYVFDPFFTTKAHGRGLGLAAVLGIIRGHGGALRLQTAEGEGTMFEILLPASGGDAREDAMTASPRAGVVLVIEDEPSIRDLVRETLEFAGHEVVTAASGEAGVDLLRERADDIALVLLDATLSGLDSASTLDRLRALRPDLVAVLMSGRQEADARQDFDLRGIPYERFLEKPFTPKALASVVGAYVKP